MSKQFRLGYKLGRLHGRLEYAEEMTHRWNLYIQNLNAANEEAAQELNGAHANTAMMLDNKLSEAGMDIADLDSLRTEPTDRKGRRKLRKQLKKSQHDELHHH